jgi:N-acyl-D-amino-acid deacylase
VDAPSRWGASAKALAMIDAARVRGLRVNAGQYLYDAASSNLGIRFPSWVLEGGPDAINARLDDPATWEKIRAEMRELIRERGLEDYDFARIAEYRTDRSLNGLTIPQAAQKVLGAADLATQQEMMRRMQRAVGLRQRRPGTVEVRARAEDHHARRAVRKMTSLPADQFGFADRGRLAAGNAADIVIFDAGTVSDTATYSRPHQYATDIVHVLVNGVPVVERGTQTDARPGRVLRHK